MNIRFRTTKGNITPTSDETTYIIKGDDGRYTPVIKGSTVLWAHSETLATFKELGAAKMIVKRYYEDNENFLYNFKLAQNN